MYDGVSRRPVPGNNRFFRMLRLLSCTPTLISRGLAHPDKRGFWRRLVNTYYGNCINLSLVFGARRGRLSLRWLALRAVGTWLRNTWLYNAPRAWRGFDVYNAEALERTLAQGKGLIVAGQHLGPQRHSFTELARHGIEVVAAMTEEFVSEAEGWRERLRQDLGDHPEAEAAARVKILPVEEPTCALKMMRALRRGSAVIFDIDGNIGVGGEEKTLEDSSLRLPFLGRQVHVRRGVAYLSYRSGAPILPIIALWGRGGRPEIHYFEPVAARVGESLEEFSGRCLREIYGLLEQVVLAQPEQWEMWPHFYKWLTSPEKLERIDPAADLVEHETQRLLTALERTPEVPVAVRAEEAYVMRIRGRHLFVDTRNFRFFFVPANTRKLLALLHAGATLEQVVRKLGRERPREAILRDLARFRLLDLLNVGVGSAGA